jgi:hypothetical protein
MASDQAVGYRKYLPHWLSTFGITMVGGLIEVEFIMYLGLLGWVVATVMMLREDGKVPRDPDADNSFYSEPGYGDGSGSSSDSGSSDCGSSSDSGSCDDR